MSFSPKKAAVVSSEYQTLKGHSSSPAAQPTHIDVFPSSHSASSGSECKTEGQGQQTAPSVANLRNLSLTSCFISHQTITIHKLIIIIIFRSLFLTHPTADVQHTGRMGCFVHRSCFQIVPHNKQRRYVSASLMLFRIYMVMMRG